jgi:hypothetical protein
MAPGKYGRPGMSLPQAIQFIQAETGKSKKVDWNINTPPTLQNISIIGAPGMDSDNSKKGKK